MNRPLDDLLMVLEVLYIWEVGVFVFEVLGEDDVEVIALFGTVGGYNSSF